MAILAIKGHPTRWREVIEIIEMLGGNNIHHYDTYCASLNFYIDDSTKTIHYSWNNSPKNKDLVIYTLEEFLEKFPYKIGDKVIVSETQKVVTIEHMSWRDNKLVYETCYNDDCVAYYTANDLQPYKEETRESKPNLLQQYMQSNQYPKTYEECCEIMGIAYPVVGGKSDGLSASTYRIDKIRPFIYLLVCRDAYWKIAGDWKYDVNKTENYFYIVNKCGRIVKEHYMNFNHILAFPTEEMRDAFYENFKDLIEQCKELL